MVFSPTSYSILPSHCPIHLVLTQPRRVKPVVPYASPGFWVFQKVSHRTASPRMTVANPSIFQIHLSDPSSRCWSRNQKANASGPDFVTWTLLRHRDFSTLRRPLCYWFNVGHQPINRQNAFHRQDLKTTKTSVAIYDPYRLPISALELRIPAMHQ